MRRAFEASDEEDDNGLNASESSPLHPSRPSESYDDAEHVSDSITHPLQGIAPPLSRRITAPISTAGPASYDFENADYDFPPPGSPPRRDRALPNNNWVCRVPIHPSLIADPRFHPGQHKWNRAK